ncbi:MAG: hydroxymethylbilane synthase [Vicinamibacterales bacterium]
MKLRIGTRGSALALWQSRHIAERLATLSPDIEVSLIEISSDGDRMTDLPLSHIEGTGFFTAALEWALLSGEVDVAVHSYKDLPVESSRDLTVAAVPRRGPVEDVLCARDGMTLETLPAGARVGTCSTRRTAQVRLVRDDLEVVSLRGNVPTRVARVGADLDAIVLARAGLIRLGLDRAISETFSIERMLPAPAQGALAVQCRADDHEVRQRLSLLDDEGTRRCVTAERQMLHALGGGCSVPVGAVARIVEGRLDLTGGVFGLATRRAARVKLSGDDAETLGELAAERLREEGASAILAEFEPVDAFGAGAPS